MSIVVLSRRRWYRNLCCFWSVAFLIILKTRDLQFTLQRFTSTSISPPSSFSYGIPATTVLLSDTTNNQHDGVVNGHQDTVSWPKRERSGSLPNNRKHNNDIDVGRAKNHVDKSNNGSNTVLATVKLDNLQDMKFYMLPLPQVTDWLLGNYTDEAYDYYDHALNEDQAELWLYRSFQRHPSRTLDPNEADVFVICGLLHFNYHLHRGGRGKNDFDLKHLAQDVVDQIVDPAKPHVLALPATNPTVSRHIGIKAMVKAFIRHNHYSILWGLGLERNKYWQSLSPDRIIPIPYVVKPPTRQEQQQSQNIPRTPNFVFYAGDRRVHAQEWSGCDRSMVTPLAKEPNMDVRLTDMSIYSRRNSSSHTTSTSLLLNATRLTQEEYNHRMETSDYCLILCGDSPTSRSLTSAMVHGCIPLQVGSRLRGLCESPCRKGWGWTISGSDNPHLPYQCPSDHDGSDSSSWGSSRRMDWSLFPEVNEAAFSQNPARVLKDKMALISPGKRKELRRIMQQHREGFIYGWGHPLNSTDFGQAASYIWESILRTVTAAS